MYFKKLTKFNLNILSEYTDLYEDRHFIFNILANIVINALLLTFYIGCIILIPIALFDHFLTGITKLHIYIRYGNLKKRRTAEIKAIIHEHGERLELNNEYYKLADLEKWQVSSVPKEFIETFILRYNYYYRTIDIHDNDICSKGRRRSLGDIYLITKYYTPTATIEDVLTILIKLLKQKKIYASYCSTIHKYVFHNDGNSDAWIKDSKTEYGDVRFNELIEIYK